MPPSTRRRSRAPMSSGARARGCTSPTKPRFLRSGRSCRRRVAGSRLHAILAGRSTVRRARAHRGPRRSWDSFARSTLEDWHAAVEASRGSIALSEDRPLSAPRISHGSGRSGALARRRPQCRRAIRMAARGARHRSGPAGAFQNRRCEHRQETEMPKGQQLRNDRRLAERTPPPARAGHVVFLRLLEAARSPHGRGKRDTIADSGESDHRRS